MLIGMLKLAESFSLRDLREMHLCNCSFPFHANHLINDAPFNGLCLMEFIRKMGLITESATN